MKLALQSAGTSGIEVPVGAVIVRQGQLLAQASNSRESASDPTAHAEISVIRSAALRLGRWNLSDCQIYVTLEPCPMCMGAILMARVPRLVFGCRNWTLGAAGTIFPLHDFPGLGLRCEVEEGVLEQQCSRLLNNFFHSQRKFGEVAEPG